MTSPLLSLSPAAEITSRDGARVYFERSGTREWNLPPPSYTQSSVPAALSRVNALLMSNWQHADQPNLKQDPSTVINDQLLIKITKKSDSEESPTPEGVHQDGTEVSSITMIERKGIQVARATRRLPRTGAPHASPATHRTWYAHGRALCSGSLRGLSLLIPPHAFPASIPSARAPPFLPRAFVASVASTHLSEPHRPLHSTAENPGFGASTRPLEITTESARTANPSRRLRALAGATASPISPFSNHLRASTSWIARSVGFCRVLELKSAIRFRTVGGFPID